MHIYLYIYIFLFKINILISYIYIIIIYVYYTYSTVLWGFRRQNPKNNQKLPCYVRILGSRETTMAISGCLGFQVAIAGTEEIAAICSSGRTSRVAAKIVNSWPNRPNRVSRLRAKFFGFCSCLMCEFHPLKFPRLEYVYVAGHCAPFGALFFGMTLR